MRHPRHLLLGPAVATLAAATLLLAGTAQPTGAQDHTGPTTHIIGGSPASAGQFPYAAALIFRGASRSEGYRCTATVLSRSWAMTAGHCVVDDDDRYPDSRYGAYVAPSALDVLTGTTSLAEDGGGQRLAVAAIHPHPSHRAGTYDWDVALLRLSRPTSAPAATVAGPADAALDDPGRTVTVAGWGVTSTASVRPSTQLRFVEVPVQTASTCADAYPAGPGDPARTLDYHDANMFCAGPLSGGKDSCQGDSGGPAVAQAADGSWRQVGITSFGYGCARAGYPGVYQRLTPSSSWIGATRRFGPFEPDGSAYVTRQYLDFAGRAPTSAERADWVDQLRRRPAADLITSLQASAAWDGNAGMNTRLYRAAFLRNPDTAGLGYWVRQRWAGRGPVSIANHFTASSEFSTKYGALSNDDFVTRIYENVFARTPDRDGRAYWVQKLDRGAGRGQVLYELSNSSEYRRSTSTLVRIITTRFGLLRTVPTPSEITASSALSQRTLIDTMRTSLRYASRFSG
ncbi:MAG: putative trypsin-like protease [Ilumatobacteraceae bacterium]|nr:putative trypsin-like protease [Ilumatobacteraceae bacterium]